MTLTHLLAATLTIAFQGLMHFQTDPRGGKHVAIINDTQNDHKKPEITICRAATSGELNCDGPMRLIKDTTVTFDIALQDKTTPKFTTSGLYDVHVPKLRDFILKGQVHHDVVGHKPPNDGVLAFVGLPPGLLTTWKTFEEQVEMKNNKSKVVKNCFARFVVLETTVSIPALMIIREPATGSTPGGTAPPSIKIHPIGPGDLVVISNIADAEHEHDNSHFHLYTKLLTKDGKLGDVQVLHNDKTCRVDDGVKTLKNPNVENALPVFRSPNGDCGPTGP